MSEANSKQGQFAPLDALNLLYALCLTVILTLFFRFDDSTDSVEPSVSGLRLTLILLYVFYFVLDWATANRYRHSIFWFWLTMSAVPFLTIAILSLFSSSDWMFLMISSYTIAAAAHDFLFFVKRDSSRSELALGTFLSAIRANVALFIFIPAITASFGRADAVGSSRSWFWALIVALVLMKILRTAYFWRILAKPI